MTGKEFLWQYIMINRKIRSVKLQLDSMIALANTSAMQDHLQSKIDDLTNSLKLIVDNGNLVKMQMINKIQQIENDNRREILINLSNSLSLAIQFSPLSPEQTKDLKDNSHITTNIQNFIVDFEDVLSEDTLKNSRYAYRVLFVPISAKRKGQADQVVEFINSDSPLAEELEKSYAILKETEKKKYLPGEIVLRMQEIGYKKFQISDHTYLWKEKDAKNPKFHYGTIIAKQWYWYQSWFDVVEQYCEKILKNSKHNLTK